MADIQRAKLNCFKSAQHRADLVLFRNIHVIFASKASEKLGTCPATLISNA